MSASGSIDYLGITYRWSYGEHRVLYAGTEPEWWGHLRLWRDDGNLIKGWDIVQALKGLICGPEALAIEVYPPASRLVDDAINMRHLWLVPWDIEKHIPNLSR